MGRMTHRRTPRARAIDSSGFEVFLIARDSPLAARDRGGSRRGGIPTPQGGIWSAVQVRRVLARAGCQFSDRRRRLELARASGRAGDAPRRHVSASRNRARDPVETQNVPRPDVRLRYTHPRKLAALMMRARRPSARAPPGLQLPPFDGLRPSSKPDTAILIASRLCSGSRTIGFRRRISKRQPLQ